MNLSWQKNKVLYILIALIILRVALVLLTVTNTFPELGIQKDLWMPNIGWAGDKDGYFADAQSLLKGNFDLSWGLGFPLFLTPFVFLFGQTDINNINLPINIFNMLVLYPLALILVYHLARILLKNKNAALGIAAFFVVYPYLFFYFFYYLVESSPLITQFYIDRFTHLIFMGPLSDFPAMIVVLLTLIILFKLFQAPLRPHVFLPLLLGFLTSFSVVSRLQNIILVPFYSLVLVFSHKLKSFFYFLLGGSALLIWQLYLNYIRYGSPFKTIYYGYKGKNFDIPMISLNYPQRVFTYPLNYSPLLFILVILTIIILIFGLYYLYLKNKTIGTIANLYLLSYTGMLLLLEPVMRNPRYFLPLIPIFFIILYAGFEFLFNRLKFVLNK